jgi:hypothetical protein
MEAEGPGRRLLNRWTVPLVTHVVAVSERVATYEAREFRIPEDRLTTIVNGVDLERFRPSARTRDPRTPVVGCTARLSAENDHATLLRAFAHLGQQWPNAQLLLVGRGPEETALRALGDTSHGGRRLRGEQGCGAVVGPDGRVAQAWPGISNSILEAMAWFASGGYTVGARPRSRSTTGLLVLPGDPALADASARSASLAMALAQAAGRARAETTSGRA